MRTDTPTRPPPGVNAAIWMVLVATLLIILAAIVTYIM